MNAVAEQAYHRFSGHVDAVIALQETPGMYDARRALAEHAAAHCRDAAPSSATSTVTLAGAGAPARRHALDLAAAITGTTYTPAAASQPDTETFDVHGTAAAVYVAAEVVRLLQTQLDWSVGMFVNATDEALNTIASEWMATTAAELEGVAP